MQVSSSSFPLLSAALPDCSYTAAKQDVTVVAMDDVLFSRSKSDCQGSIPLDLCSILCKQDMNPHLLERTDTLIFTRYHRPSTPVKI